jgi:hypothetical protein
LMRGLGSSTGPPSGGGKPPVPPEPALPPLGPEPPAPVLTPPAPVVASVVPGPVIDELLSVPPEPPLPEVADEMLDPVGFPFGPASGALQLHVATRPKRPTKTVEKAHDSEERRRCKRVLTSIQGKLR